MAISGKYLGLNVACLPKIFCFFPCFCYFNRQRIATFALSFSKSSYLNLKITIARPRRPRRPRTRREEPYRVNERIRVRRVRLVGDNVEQGIYSIEEARKIAKEQGLDLVEIAAKADPPVCKVIDYSKFKYEQKKKQKELKAKAHKVVVKEIRFGPNTDDHDFNFKLRHAEGFLKEGNKVKAYVHFAGRSILFKDRGRELLGRFIEELSHMSKVDQHIKMEGKRMTIMLAPTGSQKKKPKEEEEEE